MHVLKKEIIDILNDEEKFREYFSKKMIEMREKHGATQAELGRQMGTSRNLLSTMERGITRASLQNFLQYCHCCRVDIADFLCDIPVAEPAPDHKFTHDYMVSIGKDEAAIIELQEKRTPDVVKVPEIYNYIAAMNDVLKNKDMSDTLKEMSLQIIAEQQKIESKALELMKESFEAEKKQKETE